MNQNGVVVSAFKRFSDIYLMALTYTALIYEAYLSMTILTVRQVTMHHN